MPPIITTYNLSKTFNEKFDKKFTALKDINIEIAASEFFVFLGPSGSGKSTLLRIMSGLEKEYDGTVILNENIKQSDMSFVFQQFALLPWLTVYENIELGILSRGIKLDERRALVLHELKRFGLEKFKNEYPRELSGGMRQKVGLARAFIRKPKIIFMDEPFSELDSFTARGLRNEFLSILKETGETVIMVTHNIEEAIELSDRIAVLTPRPGKIEKIVVNHLPRPRERRSQNFFCLEDELYKLIEP